MTFDSYMQLKQSLAPTPAKHGRQTSGPSTHEAEQAAIAPAHPIFFQIEHPDGFTALDFIDSIPVLKTGLL
jgi:hypothetical protein